MKIHHIGYLVKKIEKAIAAFENLGYRITKEPVSDEGRQADICFLEKDGYVVELISPFSKDSVVAELMKKIGNSPYHICYETDNIDETIKDLSAQHYVMCSELSPAPALDGRNVCFMIHPYLGMIELLDVPYVTADQLSHI